MCSPLASLSMNVASRNELFSRLGDLLFHHRKLVLAVVFLVTAFFAYHIPAVKMLSDFASLLPQQHPYIQLHNSIRDTFGGANIINIAVEVEEGTIFTNETLARIHRITQAVDEVSNVNHNLVTSLTHRNTRKIFLTAGGTIQSQLYYDPQKKNTAMQNLQPCKAMCSRIPGSMACWSRRI